MADGVGRMMEWWTADGERWVMSGEWSMAGVVVTKIISRWEGGYLRRARDGVDLGHRRGHKIIHQHLKPTRKVATRARARAWVGGWEVERTSGNEIGDESASEDASESESESASASESASEDERGDEGEGEDGGVAPASLRTLRASIFDTRDLVIWFDLEMRCSTSRSRSFCS